MTTISSPEQFRSTVVFPTLNRIGLYSIAAEKLIMGTAAIESRFVMRHQLDGGPALGLFQMEKKTFDWLISVLSEKGNAKLAKSVYSFVGTNKPVHALVTNNDMFATAMARVRYEVVPEPIPLTVNGQAHYWKKYYNGNSKHGLSVQDYINRWNELCAPVYDAKPAALQSASPMSQSFPLQAPIWV